MFDPMLLIPLVLLGAMLIFMWRGNKKRAQQQATLREQMVVGADVMTQAGIYGTIIELDPENNVTTLETSPGVTLRVHPSTVLNVVSPTVPDDASSLTADGLPASTAASDDARSTDEDPEVTEYANETEDDLEAADDTDEDEEYVDEFDDEDVEDDADDALDEVEDDEDDASNGSKAGPLGQYRGDKPGESKA